MAEQSSATHSSCGGSFVPSGNLILDLALTDLGQLLVIKMSAVLAP